ncbi:MAG: hypothetical protein DCC71_24735, partial [Proteobacteria bacterium]
DGFARALARWAQAPLAVARDSDWSDPAGVAVVGAELEGAVAVRDAHGRERRVGFRADRVDAVAGALRLTDYKTGAPLRDAARDDTRRRALVEAVAQGRALQAVAYARGAAQAGGVATGRLLHLGDVEYAAARSAACASDDAELGAAFEAAVRSVLAAADAGVHLPRLVEPDGGKPLACEWCEVAAACQQGESGPRRRLREWASALAPDRAARAPAERVALDLFLLGRRAAPPTEESA